MAKVASMMPKIPRGKIIGKQIGGPPLSEAEHFWKCEACGGYFDMRDLGAVLEHEEPCPIRNAIKCTTVAGSSAQRPHSNHGASRRVGDHVVLRTL